MTKKNIVLRKQLSQIEVAAETQRTRSMQHTSALYQRHNLQQKSSKNKTRRSDLRASAKFRADGNVTRF